MQCGSSFIRRSSNWVGSAFSKPLCELNTLWSPHGPIPGRVPGTVADIGPAVGWSSLPQVQDSVF